MWSQKWYIFRIFCPNYSSFTCPGSSSHFYPSFKCQLKPQAVQMNLPWLLLPHWTFTTVCWPLNNILLWHANYSHTTYRIHLKRWWMRTPKNNRKKFESSEWLKPFHTNIYTRFWRNAIFIRKYRSFLHIMVELHPLKKFWEEDRNKKIYLSAFLLGTNNILKLTRGKLYIFFLYKFCPLFHRNHLCLANSYL